MTAECRRLLAGADGPLFREAEGDLVRSHLHGQRAGAVWAVVFSLDAMLLGQGRDGTRGPSPLDDNLALLTAEALDVVGPWVVPGWGGAVRPDAQSPPYDKPSQRGGGRLSLSSSSSKVSKGERQITFEMDWRSVESRLVLQCREPFKASLSSCGQGRDLLLPACLRLMGALVVGARSPTASEGETDHASRILLKYAQKLPMQGKHLLLFAIVEIALRDCDVSATKDSISSLIELFDRFSPPLLAVLVAFTDIISAGSEPLSAAAFMTINSISGILLLQTFRCHDQLMSSCCF